MSGRDGPSWQDDWNDRDRLEIDAYYRQVADGSLPKRQWQISGGQCGPQCLTLAALAIMVCWKVAHRGR